MSERDDLSDMGAQFDENLRQLTQTDKREIEVEDTVSDQQKQLETSSIKQNSFTGSEFDGFTPRHDCEE